MRRASREQGDGKDVLGRKKKIGRGWSLQWLINPK